MRSKTISNENVSNYKVLNLVILYVLHKFYLHLTLFEKKLLIYLFSS